MSSSRKGGPAKFIAVLFEMCCDEKNAPGIGFSEDGTMLELRDRNRLAQDILPRYFKHNLISSLVRQLNNYGFMSRPPTHSGASQSFVHPHFYRHSGDLLAKIRRKAALAKDADDDESPLPPAAAAATAVDTAAATYHAMLIANQQLTQRNVQLSARIRQLEDELHQERTMRNNSSSSSSVVVVAAPPQYQY